MKLLTHLPNHTLNPNPDSPTASPQREIRSKIKIRIKNRTRLARPPLAQRAFTLIELLLVLVILGILAAIVVPKFAGRTEQARQAAAQTQIANFATALDAFEVDNGYYPKGKSGLNDLAQAPRDAQSWKGPYLKEIPNDPWGKPYIYQAPGKHNATSYDLVSMGPDGRENTEDDVTNWQTKK